MEVLRIFRNRLSIALIILVAIVGSAGCSTNNPSTVVVYTSIDQPYAEPILKEFEKQTGIRVLAVYDTEATKTTGLVSRLMAEHNKPQADVFWSSEIAQTLWLKDQNVLSAYKSPAANDIPDKYRDIDGYWTGIGLRARIILVNTDLVPISDYPTSIFDLLDPKWKSGDVGIANPLFGTTATHAAALYESLGDNDAHNFFLSLKERGARVLDGNSVVRDMVVSGDIKIGLTDTDDAYSAVQKGEHVQIIFPDQDTGGTLFIPTTVSLINDGPNSEQGKKMVDFLLSEDVEKKLQDSGFLYSSARLGKGNTTISVMTVSWDRVAQIMDAVKTDLRDIFVR